MIRALCVGRTTGPSSGVAPGTIDREVMMGGVKSATTGGVHAETVATPPTTLTAPAAGHRLTSNLTGHVPDPDRHVVVVRNTRFQLMVAPSMKPAEVTVRVTVRSELGTVPENPAPVATPNVVVTPTSVPAMVAAATDKLVADFNSTLKTWLGPDTTGLSALPEEVVHEKVYPSPSMSISVVLDLTD